MSAQLPSKSCGCEALPPGLGSAHKTCFGRTERCFAWLAFPGSAKATQSVSGVVGLVGLGLELSSQRRLSRNGTSLISMLQPPIANSFSGGQRVSVEKRVHFVCTQYSMSRGCSQTSRHPKAEPERARIELGQSGIASTPAAPPAVRHGIMDVWLRRIVDGVDGVDGVGVVVKGLLHRAWANTW